ncbi:MAG: OmpA family protein [Candidatus Hydrogenedentes bacterium]|nr:OmpA family protein [Candidatus Hydrogenedentota bacterium]
MKKFVVVACLVAVVAIGLPAQAAKVWDDMSWWGNTGAVPEPQPESGRCPAQMSRCGYWWWPTVPASNVNDAELWGNRGIVYQACKPEAPVVEEPAPVETPPAPPARTAIILNNVLFDFDKAVLKAEGKAEVDKLIAEMKKYPGDTVLIEGHTCNIGTHEYNMGLGQRRADAVKKYMIENGIEEARIQTQSFSYDRPAVANDSAANRKLNRRAEFKITLAG